MNDRRDAYNMDLFAHVLPSSRAELPAPLIDVWYEAHQFCQSLSKPPYGHWPAERSFYHAVTRSEMAVIIMLNQTWHGDRKIDRMGVWHTHDTGSVAAWLQMHQTAQDA